MPVCEKFEKKNNFVELLNFYRTSIIEFAALKNTLNCRKVGQKVDNIVLIGKKKRPVICFQNNSILFSLL